jgi:hypothetical protein
MVARSSAEEGQAYRSAARAARRSHPAGVDLELPRRAQRAVGTAMSPMAAWQLHESLKAGEVKLQQFLAAGSGMSRSGGTCNTMGTTSTNIPAPLPDVPAAPPSADPLLRTMAASGTAA